jgi:hypothetical protein
MGWDPSPFERLTVVLLAVGATDERTKVDGVGFVAFAW